MPDILQRCGNASPAVYRIVVRGAVDPAWADRLGGLRIESTEGDEGAKPITVLQGEIQDQAQLSGILNTLYELRFTLLSVEILESKTHQKEA